MQHQLMFLLVLVQQAYDKKTAPITINGDYIIKHVQRTSFAPPRSSHKNSTTENCWTYSLVMLVLVALGPVDRVAGLLLL